MGLFGKRNEGRPLWKDLDNRERAAAADSFLGHLVEVATQAHLTGTDEAREEAVAHIAHDIRSNEKGLLEAALGRAVILEGEAVARHVREGAESFLNGLRSIFEQDQAEAGTQAGQERPTDLLPDDEPTTAPEAVSEPQEAAEKVWPEDRR